MPPPITVLDPCRRVKRRFPTQRCPRQTHAGPSAAYATGMRRWIAPIAFATVAWFAPAALGSSNPPTCEALVAALPDSLASAREVVVAVTLEQGGREVAYERSRVQRDDDGVTTTVLERRGLRRPDGGDGGGAGGTQDFGLPCDDHDLTFEDGDTARLELRDPDPDAVVERWSLRFGLLDGAWRPLELTAPFTVRVLFVPVRGRFVTTFEAWVFAAE